MSEIGSFSFIQLIYDNIFIHAFVFVIVCPLLSKVITGWFSGKENELLYIPLYAFIGTRVCKNLRLPFFFNISRPNSYFQTGNLCSILHTQVILHTCAITQNTIPIRQCATLKYMGLFSKESYLIRFSELVSFINTITNLFDIPGDKNRKIKPFTLIFYTSLLM